MWYLSLDIYVADSSNDYTIGFQRPLKVALWI